MKPDNCRRQWFRINVRSAFCALLIAAIFCPGTALLFAAHSPDNPRRILVIPSYNFDYKGIQWFLQGVMAEFNEQKPFNVTFSLENLQLAAHPSDRKYMDSMAASLKIKYALEKHDLIIVQYKQALQFMERYGREIFGDLPVVFAGLSVEGCTPGRLHDNYTGIVASFSAIKNIELILQNHPATKKIYVVGGFSPVEQNLVTEAINEGTPYLGKVKFVALTDMTYPALLEKLRTLETDSAVMYQALQIDAAGKVFVPAQAAIEIAKASRVPVYGMLDTYMGSGITGGFLIHHEGLGRRAAKIAIDWLQSGVAPEAKVKSEPIGSYRFDGRQLKRWGIEEDEPTLLELSTLLLSTQGYRVLAAGSPGEAIRLAGENAGEIHLLMTDVVMPEMNGRDLAKTLLALYPHLKCLFTSGYTANVIAHHGVLDENVHFIQKPFSRRDLAAKVRAVLDQK